MKKTTLQVGSFEVNSTIIEREGTVLVVDPGSEAERIIAKLAELSLTPQAILLTHGHFDHIGAVNALQRKFPELVVYLGGGDRAVLTHPANQLPPDYPPIAMPRNLCDAEDGLAELGIAVISTPGHTPGGVCYHFQDEKLLFSGDTLFAGSVGRTDLPGGDMATLMASLERLKELPRDTLVIPGHGPFTTIDRELAGNMFLQ